MKHTVDDGTNDLVNLSILRRVGAGIAGEGRSESGLDGLEGGADGRWPADGGTEPARNAAFIELVRQSSSIGSIESVAYLFSIVRDVRDGCGAERGGWLRL